MCADKTNRHHAIIEQVNADLEDSALAHLPPGKFTANAAWLVLATIAFNLAGAMRGKARTRTSRHHLTAQPHGTTRPGTPPAARPATSPCLAAETSDQTVAGLLNQADRWIEVERVGPARVRTAEQWLDLAVEHLGTIRVRTISAIDGTADTGRLLESTRSRAARASPSGQSSRE